MSTIPQNDERLKNLFELIGNQEAIAEQKRVYERLEMLLLSELFVFGRHTVTQLLMSLGLNEQDWSAWYRLFSEERFKYEKASEGLLRESLQYVKADAVYVVAGDATQTPRSSRKLEGSGWLHNMRTPPFMVGIHAAQKWFNGSWLISAENGYKTFGLARAPDIPTRWWRGSGRWSFATLLRFFRAALWGQHDFRPILTTTPDDWVRKRDFLDALKNTVYASMRS